MWIKRVEVYLISSLFLFLLFYFYILIYFDYVACLQIYDYMTAILTTHYESKIFMHASAHYL